MERSQGKAGVAVIWSDRAFNIYMGQHDAVDAAEFEPARRRDVQLGDLADTQCAKAIEERTRSTGRHSMGSAHLTTHSMERRPARG
jgi:hypothetical protein